MSAGIIVRPNGGDQLTKYLTLRKFIVNDDFTKTKDLKVEQLHYPGWPDHGVPSGESMESFRIMLDYFIWTMLKQKAEEKIIVHCSAGIGRTGTTIGLASLIVNTWA